MNLMRPTIRQIQTALKPNMIQIDITINQTIAHPKQQALIKTNMTRNRPRIQIHMSPKIINRLSHRPLKHILRNRTVNRTRNSKHHHRHSITRTNQSSHQYHRRRNYIVSSQRQTLLTDQDVGRKRQMIHPQIHYQASESISNNRTKINHHPRTTTNSLSSHKKILSSNQ